ncbi:BNR-4 repeat-containing protein [Gaetbulibacter sp. M240]|uniref:BNR-4 repeat-containing protein n=1 Tax=Gaetbulibacter sp. M240 TaxID=3126511 RepID=UPI00374E7C4F
MKKLYAILTMLVVCMATMAQTTVLSASLTEETQVAPDGLFFDGVQGVDYQFGPRITPHGDCIDVVNGYVFVTWYKGGMDKRNLMLSRKNLNDPSGNWVTIEFPHQHIGFQGDPTIGDSHNTAAIGVSTIDNTIHLLYDMHAYSSANYPNDYFNYSVSYTNKAFVPDAEFNLSIFKPKQNFLKSGDDYQLATYPVIMRAGNGGLIARYRYGGSGNGNILFNYYNGVSWSSSWTYSFGRITAPDKYSLYGEEKFLHGKFYSGFSIRYANNPNNNYALNNGLFFTYTNSIPFDSSGNWFDANDNGIAVPFSYPDALKVAEPCDDYGTSTSPRTPNDPAFTVTQSGAIHFVTRVDNQNVHYYKAAGATTFSRAAGGGIPNPDVRGDMFSYNDKVFMVELISGKPVVKSTLEGNNNWRIAYSSADTKVFKHFDAVQVNDKLYVYLMENVAGDACPMYLQVFTLSEVEDSTPVTGSDIGIEAENFTTASPEVLVGPNIDASNGEYVSEFPGNKFLEYKFNVDVAGDYDFVLTASNRNRDDSIMDIEINGVLYSNTPITRTLDWNVFDTSTISNVSLVQGENTVILTQKLSLSSRPDRLDFNFNSALSTNEFEKEGVSIYPNPSTGVFNLLTTVKNPEYILMNLQGQVLEKGTFTGEPLNFSEYSSGLYFLQLKSNESKMIKRLLIK